MRETQEMREMYFMFLLSVSMMFSDVFLNLISRLIYFVKHLFHIDLPV